jgi:CheY-like chemotaxis protein
VVNTLLIERETTVPQIVLVADDNMTIQRMAAEMLTEQGLEVLTVANGVAAIKKLASIKPIMVLADVDMPGRDGYEVCDFVKKSAELSDVPVILAFSDADPFDQERVTAVRADAVVKKPFSRPDFMARVEQFIGKSPAEQPAFAESSPSAELVEPIADEHAPSPAQFTFSGEPTRETSLSEIPEGVGLFEPEPTTAFPTAVNASAPTPSTPDVGIQAAAPSSEHTQQAEPSPAPEFSGLADVSAASPFTSSEPAVLPQAQVPPEVHALPASFASGPFASMSPFELVHLPAPAPVGSEISAAFTSSPADIAVSSQDEMDETVYMPALSQTDAVQPEAPKLQTMLDAPEMLPSVAEPAAAATSSEAQITTEMEPLTAAEPVSGLHARGGIASASVEEAATQLGDWKLQETPHAEPEAEMGQPILAAVPELATEVPSLTIEEVEHEAADALDAHPAEQTAMNAASVFEETDPLSAVAEELETVFEPEPIARLAQAASAIFDEPQQVTTPSMESAAARSETPTASAVDPPALPVADGSSMLIEPEPSPEEVDADTQEMPAAKIEEDRPSIPPEATDEKAAELEDDTQEYVVPLFPAPDVPAGMSTVENPEALQTAASGAAEQVGSEHVPEPSMIAAVHKPATAADHLETATPDATEPQELVASEPESALVADDPGSWDAPSEAALNEAFLHAALSSMSLVHATLPADIEEPIEEPAAGFEEPQEFDTLAQAVAPVEQHADRTAGMELGTPRFVDRALVQSIVQKVVVRMSPSALSPEMIEQVTKKLVEECLKDFDTAEM